MSETATTTAPTVLDPSMIAIDRSLFKRIEDQTERVTETENALKRAAEEHKDAKKAHEAATMTLTGLVNAMIRRANGKPSDTPLFDNMSDAIDSAASDPIVTTLVNRMIDHGLTHINALIVAGYDEAQRDELAKYLDALDRRKAALDQPDGFELVPEVEVPAFLQPQEISDHEVSSALREIKIEMKREHVALMTQEQRRQVLEYCAAVQAVYQRLGEAVTMDDLPDAPSFVMAPAELEREAEGEEEADTTQAADAEPVAEPKKTRAPRRSSKEFKNSPRMAGKVKKAKGKRAEAVN